MSHDHDLARAFDNRAVQFERAPVQSDPAALQRLVGFADLSPGSSILDAGCGPGLVAEALLADGHRVLGVDLSAAMIDRARLRCVSYGERARFEQISVFDPSLTGPFDATISRYVLHHVTDPAAFVGRQVALIRPGGVLVLSDHVTDPDPDRAGWHQEVERARDRTHTRNLSPGALVDLLARAGLEAVRLAEEPFTLDFDEWFDRGTPAKPKPAVRDRILAGPPARGFRATSRPDGSIRIDCHRAMVRGIKPGAE